MNTNPPTASKTRKLFALCVAALGVVYGDLGTSPLYALRECFTTGIAVSPMNIYGMLSLIFWSLSIIITLKYLTLLLMVDNQGEGGILALMSLLSGSHMKFVLPLGIFGAALLYGNGIITPAISVLSAVEGLNIATPIFQKYIIYITMVILAVLFFIQKRGSSGIGKVFGPVMVVWFVTLAVLGIASIASAPEVLAAVNPYYAFHMLLNNTGTAFLIMGAAFLAVTGGEVLYADMGHFGKTPIRINWYCLVFPALILNYFGQGAYLLHHPDGVENLFYRLTPSALLYPMIALSTAATVIAAQAVITGMFSLGRQAIQLGLWPRMTVIHTSEETIGQIYMPEVNWTLFLGTMILVLIFKTSEAMAGAYGTAVAGTMMITGIIAIFSVPKLWNSRLKRNAAIVLLICLLLIDFAFFVANSFKILHGGWIPLMLGIITCLLSIVWQRGRKVLRERIAKESMSLELFAKSLHSSPPVQVRGTAAFLTGNQGVPRILLHNLKHNKVLHEKTIILNISTSNVPFVPEEERAEYKELDSKLGLYGITLNYGFCETPDVPSALKKQHIPNLELKKVTISYFIGKESLVVSTRKKQLFKWEKKIFLFMSRNAHDVTSFFCLPPNQVTEFGIQVEL